MSLSYHSGGVVLFVSHSIITKTKKFYILYILLLLFNFTNKTIHKSNHHHSPVHKTWSYWRTSAQVGNRHVAQPHRRLEAQLAAYTLHPVRLHQAPDRPKLRLCSSYLVYVPYPRTHSKYLLYIPPSLRATTQAIRHRQVSELLA